MSHQDDGWATNEDIEEIMAGFRRVANGVTARFTPAQAGIVRTLTGQIADLIQTGRDEPAATDLAGPDRPGQDAAGEPPGPEAAAPGAPPAADEDLAAMFGATGPDSPPDDPVLARLLPDAYRDDDEAASEFRRYTEQGLRSEKAAAARTVLATLPGEGGRVRLSGEDAQAWLRALNDVRLALGVRLGITEDYEEQLAGIDRADPRSAYVHVYDWLTFLQETLVRALW